MIQNHSDLSIKVAALIKAELVNEGQYPLDIVEIVVNNFDLENRGLGVIVSELAGIIKTITNKN
jgi:hypothetical protein